MIDPIVNIDLLQEFEINNSDIQISTESAEHSLGYKLGKTPEPVREIIENVHANFSDLLEAKTGFRIFNYEDIEFGKDYVKIFDTIFDTGRIIAKQLRTSETAAIFTATIGPGIEKKSKQYMSNGDILEGYIWDAFGSDAVEKVCDILEEKLIQVLASQNLNITNRYSPGYCGWNVTEQQKLFSFLPKDFCGIQLSESSLMTPIKSVSGLIGIGRNVERTEYQCSICDIEMCIRRKTE